MKIYKEAKQIAMLATKRKRLEELIIDKGLDAEGVDWYSAELVSGLSERNGGLYQDGHMIAELGDDYYVNQWTGYCVDDYYGYLYLKTDVPGQWVKVYYEC